MTNLSGNGVASLTATLTSGSDQELQGVGTRAYQDSPTASARLAYGPPGSVTPPSPVTIAVPIPDTVVEMNTNETINFLIAAGGDQVAVDPPQLPLPVQLPIGQGGGDQEPQDPPQQPLPELAGVGDDQAPPHQQV